MDCGWWFAVADDNFNNLYTFDFFDIFDTFDNFDTFDTFYTSHSALTTDTDVDVVIADTDTPGNLDTYDTDKKGEQESKITIYNRKYQKLNWDTREYFS